MKYQVTIAGENEWTPVIATNPETAGEMWAEDAWDGRTDGYELDVRDEDGLLFAVTVDVDMCPSFMAVASKHPCAGPDGKELP